MLPATLPEDRLRDELIELNDRLQTEKNEWVTKSVARDNKIAELEQSLFNQMSKAAKDTDFVERLHAPAATV